MEAGSRPSFVVAVLNTQTTPIDFDPSEITARVVGPNGVLTPLKVYSYEELLAEEQRRENAKVALAVIGGVARGMAAADAGYSNSYGTFNASNNYGQTVQGTYTASSYNGYAQYSAQQLANAQTSRDFATIRADGERNLEQLSQTIIKKNTTLPNEWYGGTVVIQSPSTKQGTVTYIITVPFGGENHTFSVRQTHGTQ